MYCIDASVLVNSFVVGEEFHEDSKRFLAKIKEGHILVVLPEIVLPEVSSAISRLTDKEEYALDFANSLKEVPNFVFVPVDRTLAAHSSEIAAKYKLRGCDSIYAAVASQFELKLVTLDKEQLERAKTVIEVSRPTEL